MPLLSIVIPTRNRARYLDRAVASLLVSIESDPSNVETVFFGTHSTDNTHEACVQRLSRHARTRYRRHAEEASSAEESTSFARRSQAEARGNEFFRFSEMAKFSPSAPVRASHVHSEARISGAGYSGVGSAKPNNIRAAQRPLLRALVAPRALPVHELSIRSVHGCRGADCDHDPVLPG